MRKCVMHTLFFFSSSYSGVMHILEKKTSENQGFYIRSEGSIETRTSPYRFGHFIGLVVLVFLDKVLIFKRELLFVYFF